MRGARECSTVPGVQERSGAAEFTLGGEGGLFGKRRRLSVAAHDIAPLLASDTELLQRNQDADVSLRDIGSTLNELARAAGSNGEPVDPRLATVLEQVARAAMELMDAGAEVARNRVLR